jgi:hypothetical protein
MHRFVRPLVASTVGLAATALVSVAAAQGTGCWTSDTPLGALPPAKPIWCIPATDGPTTFVQGDNSWVDEFDHGLSNASIGPGYQVFDKSGSSIDQSQHFRHNNHWMVDVSGQDADGPGPWNFGGATMRPDRTFRFVDGKLVVEIDVAAGISEYGGSAWPEVVLTTAANPAASPARDSTYNYDFFPSDYTVGCRLEPRRNVICAVWDDSGRGSGSGGRLAEISSFQHEGAAAVFGGGPFGYQEGAWRLCRDSDPDLECRDRFRLEFTRDTIAVHVNGVKYMEHQGLPAGKQVPEALLNGDVFVYFGSWIYKPDAATVRLHWDRVAINPESAPAPAPPAEHEH